jgi:hypothetical protein
MVLGGGQEFCETICRGLSQKKRDNGGVGVKICPKLPDVIYGRPLT